MTEFDLPRLAVGSHPRGSGFACALNAIAYLEGADAINDRPKSVYPLLHRFVAGLNDRICTHLEEVHEVVETDRPEGHSRKEKWTKVLCGPCSHRMWMINARIIGTGAIPWSQQLDVDVTMAILARHLGYPTNSPVAAQLPQLRRLFELGNRVIIVPQVMSAPIYFGPGDLIPTTALNTTTLGAEILAKLGVGSRATTLVTGLVCEVSTFTSPPPMDAVIQQIFNSVAADVSLGSAASMRLNGSYVGFCNEVIDTFERVSGHAPNRVLTRADGLKLIDEARLVKA